MRSGVVLAFCLLFTLLYMHLKGHLWQFAHHKQSVAIILQDFKKCAFSFTDLGCFYSDISQISHKSSQGHPQSGTTIKYRILCPPQKVHDVKLIANFH